MRFFDSLKKLIFHTFKLYPKSVAASILLLTFVAAIDALSVVSLVPVIEHLSNTAPENASKFTNIINSFFTAFGLEKTLSTYFFVFSFIIFIKSIFRFFTKKFLIKVQMNYEKKLQYECFINYLNANAIFIKGKKSGDISNLINKEVERIGESLFYIYDYLAVVLKFLFYFSIIFTFSKLLVLIVIVSSILSILPSLFLNKMIYRISQRRLDLGNRVTSYILELIENIFSIKTYNSEARFSDSLNKEVSSLKTAHGKMLMLRELTSILFEPIGVVQITFIVFLALNYFHLTFSEVLIVLFTLRSILPLMGQLLTYKQVIIASLPSFNQVMSLLEDSKSNLEVSGSTTLENFRDKIVFEDVTFKYNETLILDKLNFTINKGESVALVGNSGAGKTTTFNILLGLLLPKEGAVKVDGINFKDLSLKSWRDKIGFVSQETTLLKDTLKANIAIGCNDIDTERVNEVIRLANLDDFVSGLASGIDTLISEEGVGLSGGQKQRLSLARSLYRNPEILILDEPTSALDSESESKIQEALSKLKGKVTFVIVAHRLSTIKDCDNIFVLDKGKVIESGNFDQLINQNGEFSKFAKTQGVI